MVIGGAGFIGGHLVDQLVNDGISAFVYDLKTGMDARDTDLLIEYMKDVDTVFHLAAHANIAESAANPVIDYENGTAITASVLEAARVTGIRRILYASSSAVYGDCGDESTDENYGPLIPISTYAASKIACEAMISAYAHRFNIRCLAFRFANVVGKHQPRGIAYDFMAKLRKDPKHLEILGDGNQRKSFVHVSDVVNGIRLAAERDTSIYNVYNIATGDTLTATEIGKLACETLGITDCEFTYTGGRNGWPGDVPVTIIDAWKLRLLGWKCMSSEDAMRTALIEL